MEAAKAGADDDTKLYFDVRLHIVQRSVLGAECSMQESSDLAKGMEELTTSVTFLNVAPVCKLLARSLVLYADNATRWKRSAVWDAISQVSDALETISAAVERDWRCSPLQNISSGADVGKPRLITIPHLTMC